MYYYAIEIPDGFEKTYPKEFEVFKSSEPLELADICEDTAEPVGFVGCLSETLEDVQQELSETLAVSCESLEIYNFNLWK